MLVLIGLLLFAAPTDAKRTIIRPDSGRTIATSVQAGPLILPDANTVVHVVWNGSAMVPLIGPAWAMNGTVPQVARSGKTPAGAGPFTDAAFYSLDSQPDVLDFAGDFSVCVVFDRPGSIANNPVAFSNGTFAVDGWYLQNESSASKWRFGLKGGLPTSLDTPNASIVGAVNVGCAGRAGGAIYSKLNLGAIASGTVTGHVAASTTPVRIGRYSKNGLGFGGAIYEVWASSATPSDALFIDIMSRVKARAGVTAW